MSEQSKEPPERIWLKRDSVVLTHGAWSMAYAASHADCVEYVRADIAPLAAHWVRVEDELPEKMWILFGDAGVIHATSEKMGGKAVEYVLASDARLALQSSEARHKEVCAQLIFDGKADRSRADQAEAKLAEAEKELGDERRKFAAEISEYDEDEANQKEELREAWDQNKDLRSQLSAAEQTIAGLKEGTCRWVSVGDELPEKDGWYLVLFSFGLRDELKEMITSLFDVELGWRWEEPETAPIVTHWLEGVPELPKETP